MNKLKLIAGVLLIFLTGTAAGHLGTVFYFQNKVFKQGPPALHHLIKKKISRELALTPEQQIKFDGIIAQAEKDFDAFRQKHHPELDQNLKECFQKINEILTPEQQQRFEKIKNRFQRRFSAPNPFSSRKFHDAAPIELTDELIDQLNLNQPQLNKIEPIIRQFNQDLKNGRMEGRVHMDGPEQDMHTHREYRVKIKKMKDGMMAQIKPWLDEKQFAQFQEILKNRRPRYPDAH